MPPWLTDQVIQLKTTCWWRMVEFTRTTMSEDQNFRSLRVKCQRWSLWRLKLTPELAPVATITYSHEGRELSCQLITDMAGLTLERDVGLKAYSLTNWWQLQMGPPGYMHAHAHLVICSRICFQILYLHRQARVPREFSPDVIQIFRPCDLPWFSCPWKCSWMVRICVRQRLWCHVTRD